jgi:hypothetical protein
MNWQGETFDGRPAQLEAPNPFIHADRAIEPGVVTLDRKSLIQEPTCLRVVILGFTMRESNVGKI